MTPELQRRFDQLLEEVIDELPESILELLAEVPVVALDRPTPTMLSQLGIDPDDEEEAAALCGLHSGIAMTEHSVEHSGELPPEIHLFREGIVSLALDDEPWTGKDDERVRKEIRVTLLHEIGHQFGLDEDDLDELGYG